MKNKNSYLRKKGSKNPFYKKEQAELVVKLINAGETIRNIGKFIGVTHQRIAQIYQSATGKSVGDVRYEIKLKETKKALPLLLALRQKICIGCGVGFTAMPMRKFHNIKCREEYYQLRGTQRPWYIKRKNNP